MDTLTEFIFLFVVATAGGVLNVTISGAWFIVFPGLIYRGLQPVPGTATTTLILWSGFVATSNAVRKGYEVSAAQFRYMVLACASGGILGAVLLVAFPHRVFETVAPYLLLCSYVLLVFYERIFNYVQSIAADRPSFDYSHRTLIPLFLLGIYGGYFGAGMGMVIFILYRLYGIKNNDTLEALAKVLVSINNGIALIIFIYSGLIFWPFALVMIVGSILGGYLGMTYVKKINTKAIKKVMVVVGAVVSLYFLNLINFNILQ
ncbi:sulfite exporter TauE/SafE family protein [Flavobacterium sp.]|uniref:sulfite exporter TauE/SafE family protein n=1 Tax=Flavobacterium sp. TaxID=239 RepID=UPI0039E66648